MDKKIILTILIVSLIGLTAATFHSNTEHDFFNPLSSILKDNEQQPISGLVEESGDSQNTNPHNNNTHINKDNGNTNNVNKNNNKPANPKKPTKNNTNVTPTPKPVNPKNDTPKNDTPKNNTSITLTEATKIATNWIKNNIPFATLKYIGEDDVCYNYIACENNEIIGELEINKKTGKVKGVFKEDITFNSLSVLNDEQPILELNNKRGDLQNTNSPHNDNNINKENNNTNNVKTINNTKQENQNNNIKTIKESTDITLKSDDSENDSTDDNSIT